MPWQKLIIETSGIDSERVEHDALELGALSVSLEDAADESLLEPAPGEMPLWRRVRMTVLFPDDVDTQAVQASLAGRGIAAVCWEPLEDRIWERVWLDQCEPLRFGERLWVCPRGKRVPGPGQVVYLDPGLAFGTGKHATTAACLEWLSGAPVEGRVVVDYGCGSGILGLAAATLGARRIYAIDIDEQARLATAENARSNGVLEAFRIGDSEAVVDSTADIVLANILAGPLVAIAPNLARLLHAGGRVVLSGILAEQADTVRLAYEPWFDMEEPAIRAGWARLTGKRNDRVHAMS